MKSLNNIFLGKKILIYGLGKSGLSTYHFLKNKSGISLFDDFKNKFKPFLSLEIFFIIPLSNIIPLNIF